MPKLCHPPFLAPDRKALITPDCYANVKPRLCHGTTWHTTFPVLRLFRFRNFSAPIFLQMGRASRRCPSLPAPTHPRPRQLPPPPDRVLFRCKHLFTTPYPHYTKPSSPTSELCERKWNEKRRKWNGRTGRGAEGVFLPRSSPPILKLSPRPGDSILLSCKALFPLFVHSLSICLSLHCDM